MGAHRSGAKKSSVPRNCGGATPTIVNGCLLICTVRPTAAGLLLMPTCVFESPLTPEWTLFPNVSGAIRTAPAAVLRQRILGFLRAEAEPELADIRIVRGPADLDPMMPPFVRAFLAHVWNGGLD